MESRTHTTSINQCKFQELYGQKILTAKDLFIDLDLQAQTTKKIVKNKQNVNKKLQEFLGLLIKIKKTN